MSEPEPVLVVDLFPVERQHLLQLLAQLRQERAWRLFTKGIGKDEAIQHATISGNELLARKVFDTVSIIA